MLSNLTVTLPNESAHHGLAIAAAVLCFLALAFLVTAGLDLTGMWAFAVGAVFLVGMFITGTAYRVSTDSDAADRNDAVVAAMKSQLGVDFHGSPDTVDPAFATGSGDNFATVRLTVSGRQAPQACDLSVTKHTGHQYQMLVACDGEVLSPADAPTQASGGKSGSESTNGDDK
jgi:hypothetical protein